MAKLRLWCTTAIIAAILLTTQPEQQANALQIVSKLSEVTGQQPAASKSSDPVPPADKCAAKKKDQIDASPAEMNKLEQGVNELLGYMLRPGTCSVPKLT